MCRAVEATTPEVIQPSSTSWRTLPSFGTSSYLAMGSHAKVTSYFPSKTEEQKDEESRLYKRYANAASNLPSNDGWRVTTLLNHEGFWYSDFMVPGVMALQSHFTALPDDVVLSTSPRSGTTWFKALVFSTLTRNSNHPSSRSHPLLSLNPHQLVPFLEFLYASKEELPDMTSMPSPRFYATHLPYPALPESVRLSGCKIIHVARNTRANFVSFWRMFLLMRGLEKEALPIDEAVELYARGISAFGPVWDHVGGYWKESLKAPEKVLFLRYEEVEKDTVSHVKILASFLGCPFSEEEEKRGVPDDIVKLCSFGSLSRLQVNKDGMFDLGVMKLRNCLFFSKAENREWLGRLTPEMEERLREMVGVKMAAYGLNLNGEEL